MSFLVSFNGQFSPYNLPDLSHYDRIKKVYKTKSADSDFSSQLEELHGGVNKHERKLKNHSGVSKYQKIQKSFEINRIPMYAKDLMTAEIYCFKPDETVLNAKSYLKKHSIHHLPIINSERTLVGLISDRDLLQAKNDQKISQIMSKEVISCLETTRIQDIAKILLHENINCIPIINENYNLLGILTTRDILHFMTRVAHLQELV